MFGSKLRLGIKVVGIGLWVRLVLPLLGPQPGGPQSMGCPSFSGLPAAVRERWRAARNSGGVLFQRFHCYELPSLRDCRRLFAEKLGQTIDWGPPGWEAEQWEHDFSSQNDASDWGTSDFGQPRSKSQF